MHAYSTRIDDSIPIQGTRGGGGKKKKNFCETSGRKNLLAVSLSDKKDEKKKTNFSLRKQAYGFVRFLLFFPLFLFLSNVIHFFSPPFLFSLFFLFFFLFFFFFFPFFFFFSFFSSHRESNLTGSEVVVHTESNEISLTNLKVSSSKAGDSRERIRKYGFDYCFDSSNPVAQNFADQATIYQTLGRTVLDNVFTGYNSCLVAYGQSASGKTYTMMGTKVIIISFHYFIDLDYLNFYQITFIRGFMSFLSFHFKLLDLYHIVQ